MPLPHDVDDQDLSSYTVQFRNGVTVRVTRDGRHGEAHSRVSESEAFYAAVAALDEAEAEEVQV